MSNTKTHNTPASAPIQEEGGTLRQRLERVKKTRWIRFGIVAFLFIMWVIWLGSWWVILFLPLLADIYLTHYIPLNWWKKSNNKTLRYVMGWVDAIVYALVLVYFIFIYIGQNYKIPSSSLEKTLLVGDYLWVNKMIYGPRVPNTPLHFPLAQHTIPILNCKSYIDWPQWDYHRLKGYRDVERYDIVVFNYPAGDTVALKVQNPDYYTLCAIEPGGRNAIRANKEKYGEIVYRPVDRRENYVKRAVGLPGDTLQIKKNIIYIDGEPLPEPINVQYNYFVQTDGRLIDEATWELLGISVDDRTLISVTRNEEKLGVMSIGLTVNPNGDVPPIYQLPLTKEMRETMKKMSWIINIIPIPTQEMINVYPISHDYGWTRADYGPIWIPKKGESLSLSLDNLPLYERVIKNYEGNSLEVRDGKIFINGTEASSYTFKMGYYWMMGDNRDMSADSRYWGFVPEDHIVGSPMFVIMSIDKDKGIRWNRFFKDANPDK